MRVKVDLLQQGMTLEHPIYDELDRKLLDADITLSDPILNKLKSQGREWVMLHPSDGTQVLGVPGGAADSSDTADLTLPKTKKVTRAIPQLSNVVARVESLADTASFWVENRGTPLKETMAPAARSRFEESQFKELIARFDSGVQLVDKLIDDALAGKAVDSQPLDAVAASHVRDLTSTDPDVSLYTASQLAVTPPIEERSIRLSLLSIGMAIELGLDEGHVREIGLCGLVCDWGKYLLPERIQLEAEPLSKKDTEAYQTYPLYTAELLSATDGVSREVRLAATQVMENIDGTGVPRGLDSGRIHPYASVIQVANIYLTLTTSGRGREAYVPYDAMVYLLHQTKSGRVTQSAVRALLNIVSLFPIGSLVELNDGRIARVLRRNDVEYTSPVVQTVSEDQKIRFDSGEQTIIDLSLSGNSVVRPVPEVERGEKRMTDELMDKVLWTEG